MNKVSFLMLFSKNKLCRYNNKQTTYAKAKEGKRNEKRTSKKEDTSQHRKCNMMAARYDVHVSKMILKSTIFANTCSRLSSSFLFLLITHPLHLIKKSKPPSIFGHIKYSFIQI